MTNAADYGDLVERLLKQKERAAVLNAREADKAAERESLIKELKAQGIDTDHPEQEATRLEKEIEQEMRQAEARIDQFERELDAVANGTAPTKEEAKPDAKSEPIPKPDPGVAAVLEGFDDLEIS